jgi:CheY-like chemotaxis protein
MNGKKVLVVDDDADVLFQTAELLKQSGFDVDTADGEKSAMEKLGASVYDLAVLDLMMENMDSGFILSHRIKKLTPNTKVIIMSAVTKDTGFNFSSDTREEKTWIKADSFINKDMRFEQLIGEISRLMV